ncbi:MAG TPA: 4-(cytidine 5'-diphospho)-2-C-methyl-D-erythritol kinase [Candidatus Eisenbergiella pullistercoris]|uniref:4-diphosphocytidyl-2-C-methyl-D-erythritol kinase n=1 Tax=Candidatus Eisenbergiella pullistercoris TaxID=2838555 RepID=A0A9D1YMP9_9FIRM|nr:4-(cytidine 5'-diphospho)-2-C-methyl-D-erythritol kinase [Candidatus Eisenbergiella pullistercoris]
MDKLTLKAMAKINLGLDVVRRRPDGYHEVRMIMQTVGLYDRLTFEKTKDDTLRLESSMKRLPTDGNNLIIRAASLLKEEFGIREGLSIRLDKRIPVAAGMAGGSTDAAAALTAVNRMFDLGLTEEQLKERAVKIGADVPYCLQGGTALSEGIGEILTALPPAPACHVVVAKPPIHVSTKWVYQNLHLEQVTEHPDIDGMTESIRQGDYAGVVRRLSNVLESVTVPRYPVIAQIRDFLRENGADGALMSGSGPTVFALFDDRQRARQALDALQKTGLAAQTFLTALTERTCVEQD